MTMGTKSKKGIKLLHFSLKSECWDCNAIRVEKIEASLRKAMNDGRVDPSCGECGSRNIDWDVTQRIYFK